MMRPRKMKWIEFTILERDVDAVIAYLGRRGVIHLSQDEMEGQGARDTVSYVQIQDKLNELRTCAAALGFTFPEEIDDSAELPNGVDAELADSVCSGIAQLRDAENEAGQEKKRLEETLSEAQSFQNLNAPFSELDQLSYLTLRIGRLEGRKQARLRENLGDRAVIIPLGTGPDGVERILAAASRKGRFALDSELKRQSFVPIVIPEGYKGVPEDALQGMKSRLGEIQTNLEQMGETKVWLREEYQPLLRRLLSSYMIAAQVEQLKSRLNVTATAYMLRGWMPEDVLRGVTSDLGALTEDRLAIHAFSPEEVSDNDQSKIEKVPVALKHGVFVRGFERVVFSYGSPLYGAIDPTPFVAFFFTILFGIMFGDLGQGLVLLILGLLCRKGTVKALKEYRGFASPLIAVSVSSMIMGLLTGSVFTNEELLAGPTRVILGFFMRVLHIPGEAPERILHLMPDKDNIAKLFYFFGFTIAVGVVLNSIGLWVNIINLSGRKKYEQAFFSKTGLSGLILFWYALSIAIRVILGGSVQWFDSLGLLIPAAGIFFGPALWRLFSGHRPVLEDGLMAYIMEGIVEILETASTYISNTVSFLRVGAFALSHAVLSFIVFTLSGMVRTLPVGPAISLGITIFGNVVIIVLEGMIVAIQVMRLQYYEFFSKFFTETGVEFSPFRFHKGV